MYMYMYMLCHTTDMYMYMICYVMMKPPFKASESAINVKHAPWFAGFNLEIFG